MADSKTDVDMGRRCSLFMVGTMGDAGAAVPDSPEDPGSPRMGSLGNRPALRGLSRRKT